jgi:hybrid cluster-associated redox disulfide protein
MRALQLREYRRSVERIRQRVKLNKNKRKMKKTKKKTKIVSKKIKSRSKKRSITKKIISKIKKDLKAISKKMTFAEIIKQSPKAGQLLAEKGLMCGGCPMALMETLEQGAQMHGLNPDELIKDLNEELNKKF